MPVEVTFISAFLIGLIGSTHCIGMCGGIVGALTLGTGTSVRRSSASLFGYLIAYNVGRIASYSVAGAVVGFISVQLFTLAPSPEARIISRSISSLFMIALGFYVSGWWTGLSALERLGAKLWRRIEPLGRRLLPVNHPAKAVLFGLVWGWLPCGLVYSALAWSLASGSAAQGAFLMAAFGLGTLPMLLAMGAAARWLSAAARNRWVRQGAGVLLIVAGAYLLLMPTAHVGHSHA